MKFPLMVQHHLDIEEDRRYTEVPALDATSEWFTERKDMHTVDEIWESKWTDNLFNMYLGEELLHENVRVIAKGVRHDLGDEDVEVIMFRKEDGEITDISTEGILFENLGLDI